MLNLYIATRGFRAPVPAADSVNRVVDLLREQGVIGDFADSAYAPGRGVAHIFHADAHEVLLPAELTFDSLTIHVAAPPVRAKFLPQNHGEGFTDTRCGPCGEAIEQEVVELELARLRYYPPERFQLGCPSCGAGLRLRDVDFPFPVSLARFWIFIEGAATGRLTSSFVDRLSRQVGLQFVVVPEVPADEVDDWVPARRRRRRREFGPR